jgi:GNAT superfamily N-acetyltransferase
VGTIRIRIVRLTTDDWERLRALRLRSLLDAPDAFGSTYAEAAARDPEGWVQQLRDLPSFVAVNDDDADVGMVRYIPDHQDADTAMLISMWVAPEARRHGVGAALIDTIVDYARTQDVARLILDVADHNVAAIALYARKGFVPTGESGSMPVPREHVGEHRRALQLR